MDITTTSILVFSYVSAGASVAHLVLATMLRKGVNPPHIDPPTNKPYTLPKPAGVKRRPRVKDDAQAWIDEQEEQKTRKPS